MSPSRGEEFETLLVSADGPRGEIVLNRPQRRNAMSALMLEELATAARWFDEREAVKVVVIRGAGSSFSAGADLQGFTGDVGEESVRASAARGRAMSDAIATTRSITIAAIRGHCLGGAMVLAAACDLRVAADDARFALPEVDLGIPLTWGGVPLLTRTLGPAIATELILTCRTAEPEELRGLGFLNAVVSGDELEARVEALAEKVASQPRDALRVTKRQVASAPDEPFDEGQLLIDAFGDPEAQAKARAYLEGRRLEGRRRG